MILGGGYYMWTHLGDPFKTVKNYPLKTDAPKIVAFGDSLTAGYGASKGNDYVTVLSEKLGVPIVNKGKEGDTTTDALKRLPDVEKEQPDVVLVYLGGNDFLRHIPTNVTFTNLEKIISHLQEQGALVVVVGIRGGLLDDPYKDHFKDITSRYHTVYVSDLLLDVMGKKNMMFDAVHPNDKGYEYIADHIYSDIKGIFKNVKG